MDDLTDKELLSRYVGHKNEAAFACFVRRHLPLVYHTARRRLEDHHSSEDVAQTVFALLARKASTLTDHPTLPAWLYQTTQFVALREQRRLRNHEKRTRNYQHHMKEQLPDDDWDSNKRLLLDQALQKLGETERRLLVLHYVEGYPCADAGRKLGKSEGACRVQANRALKKLSQWFSSQGQTLSGTVIGCGIASQFLGSVPTSMAATVAHGALKLAPTLPSSGILLRLALDSVAAFRLAVGILTASIAVSGSSLVQQSSETARLRQVLSQLLRQRAILSAPAQPVPNPVDDPAVMLARLRPSAEPLTADALVQQSLAQMFSGARKDAMDRLVLLGKPELLRLLQEVEAHPVQENFKPILNVLWALGSHDPRLACEKALLSGDSLFGLLLSWLRKDPVAGSEWLREKMDADMIDQDQIGPLTRIAACAMVPIAKERAFEIMRWAPTQVGSGQLGSFAKVLMDHGTPPVAALDEVATLLAGQSYERLVESTVLRLADEDIRVFPGGLGGCYSMD